MKKLAFSIDFRRYIILNTILLSLDDFKKAFDEGRIEQQNCGEAYCFVYTDNETTKSKPFCGWPSQCVKFKSFDDLLSAKQYSARKSGEIERCEYWIYAKYKSLMQSICKLRDDNLTIVNLMKLAYGIPVDEISNKYPSNYNNDDAKLFDIEEIADMLVGLVFEYLELEVYRNNKVIIEHCMDSLHHNDDNKLLGYVLSINNKLIEHFNNEYTGDIESTSYTSGKTIEFNVLMLKKISEEAENYEKHTTLDLDTYYQVYRR